MKKKGTNTVTKTQGMGNRPCMMKHVVREQCMKYEGWTAEGIALGG